MGYPVPPSPKWLREAAARYLPRGDVPAAEAAARRVVHAYPEDVAGYAVLADGYLAERKTEAARRVLDEALRVVDGLEFFDESARVLMRAVLREHPERLAQHPPLQAGRSLERIPVQAGSDGQGRAGRSLRHGRACTGRSLKDEPCRFALRRTA